METSRESFPDLKEGFPRQESILDSSVPVLDDIPMYNLKQMNLDPKGTVLVHSSYKSIGDVENGPLTVLETLIEYMSEGLLVFPSHTRATVHEENPIYSVTKTPGCIKIIPRLPGAFHFLS